MKTEPTEKEKIIKGLEIKIRNCDDGLDEVSWAYEEGILISKRDAINLVELLKYSPKIKQLEWEEYRDCLVSTTQFYNVSIKEVCGIYELVTAYSAFIKSYNSLDEAKAAAQADFEKRINESLE